MHLTTLLTFALPLTSAHFLLNYPATAGFNDDNEGIAPCGGFSISYTNATNWHVGGDAIAVQSTHPAATWLYRATLDTTAAGNYSNLLPAVSQSALGAFCVTSLMVPPSWAGSRGVIQVVQSATDGFLYQCAPVNFVSGAATSNPTACTNATGVTAVFTQAAALSSLPVATATARSSSSTGTATGTAATASASTRSDAMMNGASTFWAAAGLLGAAVVGGL